MGNTCGWFTYQNWCKIKAGCANDEAYKREVQDWVQSLLVGQPTGPTVWDGYVAMVVADAFVKSAETGQPQEVPVLERPALYER